MSDAISGIGIAMLVVLAALIVLLWVVLAGRAARRAAESEAALAEPQLPPRRLSLIRRIRRPDGEADVLKLEKASKPAPR